MTNDWFYRDLAEMTGKQLEELAAASRNATILLEAKQIMTDINPGKWLYDVAVSPHDPSERALRNELLLERRRWIDSAEREDGK